MLIEAEHSRLRQALRDDVDEIVLDGQVMSPRPHITLHEIVAERLWANEPPETWRTAQRLSALDCDRHEVLHMLKSVLSGRIAPGRAGARSEVTGWGWEQGRARARHRRQR